MCHAIWIWLQFNWNFHVPSWSDHLLILFLPSVAASSFCWISAAETDISVLNYWLIGTAWKWPLYMCRCRVPSHFSFSLHCPPPLFFPLLLRFTSTFALSANTADRKDKLTSTSTYINGSCPQSYWSIFSWISTHFSFVFFQITEKPFQCMLWWYGHMVGSKSHAIVIRLYLLGSWYKIGIHIV